MKIIPNSHTLVIMVGPSGAGKSTFIRDHFNSREVVSSDDLRYELTGDFQNQHRNFEVFEEFHRRIEAKLRLGNRVIADATHLHRADRIRTAESAKSSGAKVIYVVINRSLDDKAKTGEWRNDVIVKGGKTLIEKHHETFVSSEAAILAGDFGVADMVVDTRTDDFTVAKTLMRDPKFVLRQLHDHNFRKLRVIGDVHGNIDGLNKALDTSEDTFFLFLGDVVDYGEHTLETTAIVADLVANFRAIALRGNHERKIYNVITKNRTEKGFAGTLTHGNDVTLNKLKTLSDRERLAWENRFLAFVDSIPDHLVIHSGDGRFLFVHAAAHKGMWNDRSFRLNGKLESVALYGETTGKIDPATGYPERLMTWVDEVPEDHTVIVGHAILSTEKPIHFNGNAGGHVVFLDTGSSKVHNVTGDAGHLSWIDFDIVKYNGRFFLTNAKEGSE